VIRTTRDQQYGFGLIEAVIGLLLLIAVSGFALLNIKSILPLMSADAAMKQTLSQLRSGREKAIAQRRNIEIRFLPPNQIQLLRYNEPIGTTVLSTITLQGKNEFRRFVGVPDTPDGFGNLSAISFGAQAPWIFLSDGTLIDSSTNPVNGTVFLGQANRTNTARAVTILGATGRVRDYTWTGTSWFH
jgi:Tfp pilus assembly protein FimT